MKKLLIMLSIIFIWASCSEWNKQIWNKKVIVDEPVLNNTSMVNEDDFIKIEKKLWDKIVLSTIELKVIKKEEKDVLTSQYGSPRVAQEWTKFVLLEVSVKNILKEPFYDWFTDIYIEDSNGNKFLPIDVFSDIDNYIARDFQPWIEEKGIIVYKVPKDSKLHSLIIWKGWTKDFFYIKTY